MIASPTKILEKKPSELKNALILMHGDQVESNFLKFFNQLKIMIIMNRRIFFPELRFISIFVDNGSFK